MQKHPTSNEIHVTHLIIIIQNLQNWIFMRVLVLVVIEVHKAPGIRQACSYIIAYMQYNE